MYRAKPNREGRDDSEWLVVDGGNRPLTLSMPRDAAQDLAAAWNRGAERRQLDAIRGVTLAAD